MLERNMSKGHGNENFFHLRSGSTSACQADPWPCKMSRSADGPSHPSPTLISSNLFAHLSSPLVLQASIPFSYVLSLFCFVDLAKLLFSAQTRKMICLLSCLKFDMWLFTSEALVRFISNAVGTCNTDTSCIISCSWGTNSIMFASSVTAVCRYIAMQVLSQSSVKPQCSDKVSELNVVWHQSACYISIEKIIISSTSPICQQHFFSARSCAQENIWENWVSLKKKERGENRQARSKTLSKGRIFLCLKSAL